MVQSNIHSLPLLGDLLDSSPSVQALGADYLEHLLLKLRAVVLETLNLARLVTLDRVIDAIGDELFQVEVRVATLVRVAELLLAAHYARWERLFIAAGCAA